MDAVLVPMSFWYFLQQQVGTCPLVPQTHIALVLVEDIDTEYTGPKPAAEFQVIHVENNSI
jgi:hypothetical protein